MKSESILMRDSSFIYFDRIRERFSQDIYQTDFYYDVCEFFASRHLDCNEVERKVLMNLYALKSPRIKNIASLVYLLKNHGEQVSELHVFNDVAEVLLKLNVPMPVIHSLGQYPENYLGFQNAIVLAQKAIAHRLFRLFTKPLSGNKQMLRGWVDVTAAMYPELMPTVNLKLYPFPHGILRQFKFYQKCRKEGVRTSLAGLPYSLIRVLRSIFSSRRRDVAIMSAEVDAYGRYAQELLGEGVTNVYTSDEFEVAAVALYNPLHSSGVEIVNTAHGVGLYCPNVSYTKFLGINSSQANFYQERCSFLSPAVREQKNATLPLGGCHAVSDQKYAVVLIDQNFHDFGCIAEAAALESIKTVISGFARSKGIDFYIKLHPNSKTPNGSSIDAHGAIYIKRWTDLLGLRPAFITINSTTFYDVKGYGPMLVYAGDSFFPGAYFGEGLKTFNLESLGGELDLLMDSTRWLNAALEHQAQ